jgi:hypothetical protein
MPTRRLLPVLVAVAVIALSIQMMPIAQSLAPAAPSWIGALVLGMDPLVGADASSPSVTDALGFKFELYYAAVDAQDPQNLTNQVISMDTTGGAIGVALRKLNPGVKIATLSDQLHIKYFFPARTCAGGSPRFQLAIDTDGDGNSNGNAFGYVGHAGFGGGCVSGVWDFVDMSDAVVSRWDLTQFGLGYHSWQTAVAAITTAFPNHQVLRGSLVDDSAGFAGDAAGQAYYDLVTIGHRTLENWDDTVH